jgi:hypothetical protein
VYKRQAPGYPGNWAGPGYPGNWAGPGYPGYWAGPGYPGYWAGPGYPGYWAGPGYRGTGRARVTGVGGIHLNGPRCRCDDAAVRAAAVQGHARSMERPRHQGGQGGPLTWASPVR